MVFYHFYILLGLIFGKTTTMESLFLKIWVFEVRKTYKLGWSEQLLEQNTIGDLVPSGERDSLNVKLNPINSLVDAIIVYNLN